jgi:hypothetical protein
MQALKLDTIWTFHVLAVQHNTRSDDHWPRGLKHVLCSPTQTLRSWFWFPPKAWRSVCCIYSVCVVLCVGRGLAMDWAPPSKVKKLKSDLGPTMSCGAINKYHSFFIRLYSPIVGPWPTFQFSSSYTQSVYGRSARRKAPTYTQNYTHRINAHKHPCLELNSNPRSRCWSGRTEFMPQTARPLWSANNKYSNTIYAM